MGTAHDIKLFDDKDIPEVTSDIEDINNPSHYTRWKKEPLEFCMENDVEFWRCIIIKYAMRAGFKKHGVSDWESEIQDLQKVRRYAEMRINFIKGEEEL